MGLLRKKKHFLYPVLLLLLFVGINYSVEKDELIAEISRRYNLNSFYMNVTRITNCAEGTDSTSPKKEDWSIYYKSPYFFRLHYFAGQDERFIVGNKDCIWEYVPKHKALLETDIRHLSDEEKLIKTSLATAIVRLPFIWIYNEIDSLKDINITEDILDGKKVFLIMGKLFYEEKVYQSKIWLDQIRLNILKLLLLDEQGEVAMQVDYLLPKEVASKVWFSGRVDYLWKKNDKKNLTVNVVINKILLNENYDDNLFTFKKTKDMKIWTKKAKNVKKEGGE